MSEPTPEKSPDPYFDKAKAFLDPIVEALNVALKRHLGDQAKPIPPFKFKWLNKAHTAFTGSAGKTMEDMDCAGVLIFYDTDIFPNDRGEIFVSCYNWTGSHYKGLATILADEATRAGHPARVTTRKKSLGVAIKVDVEKWYA